MKNVCLTPAFYRLGTVVLLITFAFSGCADWPAETRYDNTVRQYSLGQDENAQSYSTAKGGVKYAVGPNAQATASYAYDTQEDSQKYVNREGGKRYTIGRLDNATAHYAYKPGHRPDTLPRDRSQLAGMSDGQGNGLPATPPADMALVIDVNDVLFDFDKSVIKVAFYPELDSWVQYFLENPQVTAEIYGHADSTGPTAYNQDLSERRAQAVVNYMVERGVERSRLLPRGFGEMKPVAPNTTREGRQKNRRVELNF